MSEPGLSRRSLLSGAAVTAVAGVAGYAVAANSDAAGTRDSTAAANGEGAAGDAGTRLAAVADIPDGSGLILSDPGVVLSLDDAGAVVAFSAICTHQGCTVNAIEDRLIVCPCHLSRFDLGTGAPVSGPAQSALPPVAVEVRGEEIFTA